MITISPVKPGPTTTIPADMARLLCRILARMSWGNLTYSEGRRLARALERLDAHVTLARTILNTSRR